MKLPRYRTGDAALDDEVAALVERVSRPRRRRPDLRAGGVGAAARHATPPTAAT